MKTIPDYLIERGPQDFVRRASLQERVDRLPRWWRKEASRFIWKGSYRHLRELDHAYTFEADGGRLSAMSFHGQEIARSVQCEQLIGRIERPVTLVTTGPSALEHDWDALKKSGRMIVGVTGGATFLRERGLEPDLLVVTDPNFCRTGGFHVRDAEGVPLFVEYRCAANLHKHFPETFINRPVSFMERVNKWYGLPSLSSSDLRRLNQDSGEPFMFPDQHGKIAQVGWSDHPDLGFFPSATVAFVALQLIIALGASDIEIVGMDLGGGCSIYSNARPSALAEQYEPTLLPSFKVMHSALAGRDISIRNLSPHCPLPPWIFERKSV